MPLKRCLVVKLGMSDYTDALSLQKRIHTARCENKVDDVLLLVEYPHVFTIGTGADKTDLLISEETLGEKGIPVLNVKRGGRITYHGPEQLVGYPIIDLSNHFRDIHLYLRKLEEVIILTLKDYNIIGKRVKGMTGVWVGDKKIATIGVEFRKWVTMHGFALNVNPDLSFFPYIVPCGIKNKEVTSMLASGLPQSELNLDAVGDKVAKHFAEIFEMDMYSEISLDELESLLQQRTMVWS